MQAANSPRPSESSLAFNYELRLESSGVRENRSSRLRIRSGPAPPAPRFLWRILCFLIFQAMINFDLRCRAAELAKAPFANPGPSTICNIGSIAMATQQTLPPLPPPKWVVDLKSPLPRPSISASSIPDPPGFSRKAGKGRSEKSTTSSAPSKPAETDTLKLKKAWEIALAPSKQIPMNAIMMYMSGNSLQIFSIMMVFMLFKGPIQGLINTNNVFAKFDSETLRGNSFCWGWGCGRLMLWVFCRGPYALFWLANV
ncbi:hypothetical protein AN5951.2 [Aspergillus nidulans FGSC A4]|uniref:ER membrane protein complex subunit 4 n=1 Tax=Emericella nidulans (strain FGSC A4 / ATCC 38163 / CBS 112.46 / NRRL 194 / M139) TaxID=227321 RepID=Q5B0H9_EMENI|nr:chaperone EMC4 [Aspergillus nidulans FGSC A4]EAA57814.1 hypothetical protein AN5951.2 [Aspergillus nidulans FGSC A4]CBF70499.1 TPA: ER membrane DUF1077 domain protein, putative (AFU_orthologue; AFUA_2G10350) [Aspergillus nidulans FGSC A4]|eukprot:XP_663555.1 hypothetical protein AN5951.2 [Aspergillus nidulans FGSC A4]